jgi:hypothetical protein
MATQLARRLERLEQALRAPDETVELLGVWITRQRLAEILRAAMGTTIEPRTAD